MGHTLSQCKMEKTYKPTGRVLKDPSPRGAFTKNGSLLKKPTSKGPSTGSVRCSNTFGALNDVVDNDQHVSCLDDSNKEGVNDVIVQPLPSPVSPDINMTDINDCIIPEARNEDHFLGDLETKETGFTTKLDLESLANLTMPLGRNNVIIGCRNDISSTNGVPEEDDRSLSMSEKLVQYPKIISTTLDKTNSIISGAASEISSTSQCVFLPHPTYSYSTINKLLKGRRSGRQGHAPTIVEPEKHQAKELSTVISRTADISPIACSGISNGTPHKSPKSKSAHKKPRGVRKKSPSHPPS
ncbi:hypothetical protein Nepgr_017485 [Nepenthes gracilis]|uniref:Uncharacterized protein n=1 Tax=Nepenthes gracilis TaxID=150966 RepID=A0AAD3XT52_NEPGR|nr:hypothetical protein Nepgr_017485 [Nepenthes gracilis]